jgi:hypothetical protein
MLSSMRFRFASSRNHLELIKRNAADAKIEISGETGFECGHGMCYEDNSYTVTGAYEPTTCSNYTTTIM